MCMKCLWLLWHYTAELSSCDKHHTAPQVWNVYYLNFYRKKNCQPLFYKVSLAPGYKWQIMQVFRLEGEADLGSILNSRIYSTVKLSNLPSRDSRFWAPHSLGGSAGFNPPTLCSPAEGWIHLTEEAPSNMFTYMCTNNLRWPSGLQLPRPYN